MNVFKEFNIRCEDHTCSLHFHVFPCDDGQCDVLSQSCNNACDQLLHKFNVSLVKSNQKNAGLSVNI
jgi:hypothetical protein